jgi:hypothetical protein
MVQAIAIPRDDRFQLISEPSAPDSIRNTRFGAGPSVHGT